MSEAKQYEDPTIQLVVACLQEAMHGHSINILEEINELTPDYHVEVTLTVEEIYKAAKKLGIVDF